MLRLRNGDGHHGAGDRIAFCWRLLRLVAMVPRSAACASGKRRAQGKKDDAKRIRRGWQVRACNGKIRYDGSVAVPAVVRLTLLGTERHPLSPVVVLALSRDLLASLVTSADCR